MNLISKTVANIFKVILGSIIFLLTFTISIHIYTFVSFPRIFLTQELSIIKYSMANPLKNIFKVLNDLWIHYSNYANGNYLPIIILTLLSIVVSLLAVFFKNFNKKGKGPNNSVVIRGPKLLGHKELNKAFNKLIYQEANEIYKDLSFNKKRKFLKTKFIKKLKGHPFSCSSKNAEVKIPDYILLRHIAFIGTTGSGKTTQIKHYIDHANILKEKSIIIDLNGEIFSEMGQKGDIIISPFDSRSCRWDFSYEKSFNKPISSSEFSKYIIPKGGEQNSFWWKGARTVFSELLDNYPSSSELWNAISDPDRKFRDHLSGIINNIIGKIGSNQDAGIFGTLSSDLGFLKHLISFNSASTNDYFSITKWAQDETVNNVFIIFSDKDLESISPLIRIWLNLAVLGRFEAGKDNNLPLMNIIIDEIGSLGHLDKLPNAVARLRKYGGKVILGLQSEGQLASIYGEQDAKTIKGNIGSRFIFRTPEEVEAKNLSIFLGRSEVINVSQNSNIDEKGNLRISESQSTSYKDIVLDSEIRELADGHFYLKSLNLSPAKLRIKKKKWDTIHPLHQSCIFNSRNFEIKNKSSNNLCKKKETEDHSLENFNIAEKNSKTKERQESFIY